MNPYSLDMMKIYHAFRALHQMDENCADYIEFAASIPAQSQQAASAAGPAGTANSAAGSAIGAADPDRYASELQRCIIKGLKESAGEQTQTLSATLISLFP